MSLESKFSSFFPDRARQLGQELYAAGAVHVYRGSPVSAIAEVSGESFHEAELEVVDKELLVSCCCDVADEGLLCGHAFATLLACDQLGELQRAGTRAVRKFARSRYADASPLGTPIRPKTPSVLPQTCGGDSSLPRTPPQFSPRETQTDGTCELGQEGPSDRRIVFAIDWRASQSENGLVIQTYWQTNNNDHWSALRAFTVDSRDGASVPPLLTTAHSENGHIWRAARGEEGVLLEKLLDSGCLFVVAGPRLPPTPYAPVVESAKLSFAFLEHKREQYQLRNTLTVNGDPIDLHQPAILLDDGYLLLMEHVVALTPNQHFWLDHTLFAPAVYPHRTLSKLAAETQTHTTIPARSFPAQYQFSQSQGGPVGQLYIRTAHFKFRGKEQLHAELSFNYAGTVFDDGDEREKSADSARAVVVERDFGAEEALREQMYAVGFRFQDVGMREEFGWKLLPADLPTVVEALVLSDWLVTAEGKTYRKPSEKKATISYKTDWFELDASVTYGDQKVSLPELLTISANGSGVIVLDDGSQGVLPTEWLRNYTVLTEIGLTEGELVKFTRAQYILVDQLLQEQADLTKDQRCLEQEEAIRAFTAITGADAPDSFQGTLRDYQREGLGWMRQMAQLQLGVCLADDMGLGKTIQILSLLADQPKNAPPSLVILPKSLVFNWHAEAKKFCPHLRVTDYTGSARKKLRNKFSNFDVILTTYGTVRRDVMDLKDQQFNYCILDESQAIKNFDSQAAKAVRLLNAKNRICMTGTPIENNLAELLSQFEFMNPRLLGRLPAFKDVAQLTQLDGDQIAKLQRAIAPFFLRRTKKQVAKELPDKTVQVLYCELGKTERKRYDELKLHFQKEFLADKATKDVKKPKKPIFQALLRLRQAASHPGLSNPKLIDELSSKQKLMQNRLKELISEGHKVLIFSQFTSFLSIIKKDCEDVGISYTYLDGKTKDRDAEVQRFQSDESVKAFIISLKAGGVGLNLTAADYVFLLDPWWNPAIEAQAIDRAYRIGQKKHVFAYKVIAKDTIEEKVLELQQQKQDLAEAVFSNEGSAAIQNLTRDDLEFLLT